MVRLGLIGCGRIGRVHADSITVHPRAELAHVVDPFESSAREVGEQFVGAVEHGRRGRDRRPVDRRRRRRVADTDARRPAHPRRPDAGKAVLCEKPIDLDIARVDACSAEIGALTDRVMLGFNRRFDPSFADIRSRGRGGRDRHARAADDHQPRPGTTARGLRRHLRRAVPRHDHPRLRHGPLLPRRRRRGQRHRREPGLVRDRRGRRHRRRGGRPARCRRRAVLDHQLAARRVRLRPAARGVRRARHAERGQPAADERPLLGRRAAPRSRRRTTTSSSTGTRRPTGRSSTRSSPASSRAAPSHPASPTAVPRSCWPTRRTRACGPAPSVKVGL